MAERIDAHHHLWRYNAAEYGWLAGPYAALERDFLLAELRLATAEAGVTGTIAVQARQSIEETQWLLELASESGGQDGQPLIRGVVGWAPLADASFEATLEELRRNRALRGLRHIAQAEAPEFLEGREFNRGIAALRDTGLVYEVLVYERQLGEALALVDRHPGQSFVLDHIGKPRIGEGLLEPWATGLRALAQRGNVTCKLSGLVTEAAWATWTPDSLAPYLEVAVEAFGPGRLMAGSDWPVCLVASGYGQWWRVLESYFAGFSAGEREAIFGGTAQRVYGLGR